MEIVTNQRIILYDIHNNLTTQEAKKGGVKRHRLMAKVLVALTG